MPGELAIYFDRELVCADYFQESIFYVGAKLLDAEHFLHPLKRL